MAKVRLLMFFVFCSILGFTSCSNDDTTDFPPPADPAAPHEKTNRTVLAYMVGDMNLWYKIEESLNLMEKGWDETIDGTLLVYLDNSIHLTQFGQPVLLEITHDETDRIVSKVVKAYADQDAGDPDVMLSVLNDAITLYPAESHGLIIGAHGNGWIPEITDDQTKGLAGPERYGSTLEIDALAKILPLKYDFILFHACNMANVETAYQLRNKCEYLMGSAFSLPGYGYPYDQIIPYLYTKPRADLYKASLKSYTEYETKIDPSTYTIFSVEVIKTSELENLAAATSRLLDDINMSYEEIRNELYKEREEMADTPIPDKNFVIDFYENLGLLLDLNGLSFLTQNDELTDAFEAALNKTVIQNFVIGTSSAAWKMNCSNLGSGLSFYLPVMEDTPLYNQLNSKFKNNYEWAKASGFIKDR